MTGSATTALAVLELEWTALPNQVTGLERYAGALVLIRLDGRPVGQALLPVDQGRLGADDLRYEILCAANSSFWEAWLADFLRTEGPRSMSATAPPVTVAVCTRDRTADLKNCLVALQALADDGQEVVIIDNAPSSDESHELVQRFPWARYVREDRPGLDCARNRALREARHEIVAFTDDDATVDPSWLRALMRHFTDERVACVTGLTMPMELETPAQVAYEQVGGLARGFRRAVYDRRSLDSHEAWKVGAGVNMALRRQIALDVGGFDECLDVGTPVAGGGDTDMFRRLLNAGHRLVYEPEALVWHRHRTTRDRLVRQIYGYESAAFAILARSLWYERDIGAMRSAWDWVNREIPHIFASILGLRDRSRRDFAMARLRGALVGPWAYLSARARTDSNGGMER